MGPRASDLPAYEGPGHQSWPKRFCDVHWSNQDAALLTVRKPGGLELGIHEVDVAWEYSASYLPPRIDLRPMGNEPRKMVLVR